MFLFGFRDERIDEGIKRLFKKAIKYYRKLLGKELNTKSIEEILSDDLNKSYFLGNLGNLPIELLEPMFLRLMGESKKNIKTMFPLDSTDEIYDPVFDFATETENQIAKMFHLKDFEGDMAEDYINEVIKLIPNYPSFSESMEMINKLKVEDLTYIQVGVIMTLGFSVQMGVSPEQILQHFKSSKFIYGCCLLSLFTYVNLRHFIPKLNPVIRDQLLSLPEETGAFSMSKDESKPKGKMRN